MITGAAGKIGTALRAGLRGRFPRFRVTDRAPIPAPREDEEAVVGDISDRSILDGLTKGVDCLVHLAGAPDPVDFETMFRVNARGMFDVFEASRRNGVKRIVFASTNHTFGMYPVQERVTPALPPRPDSFYGVTKVFGETLLRYYFDKHGIESVSLRIGTFRALPEAQRHLSTWFSIADAVRLFERALKQPQVGCLVVNGYSRNARLRTDDPNWVRIGYRPEDDAEEHRESLAAAGVDVDGPLQWPIHGGEYLPKEY
jgi:uronate dehydrogenase